MGVMTSAFIQVFHLVSPVHDVVSANNFRGSAENNLRDLRNVWDEAVRDGLPGTF